MKPGLAFTAKTVLKLSMRIPPGVNAKIMLMKNQTSQYKRHYKLLLNYKEDLFLIQI